MRTRTYIAAALAAIFVALLWWDASLLKKNRALKNSNDELFDILANVGGIVKHDTVVIPEVRYRVKVKNKPYKVVEIIDRVDTVYHPLCRYSDSLESEDFTLFYDIKARDMQGMDYDYRMKAPRTVLKYVPEIVEKRVNASHVYGTIGYFHGDKSPRVGAAYMSAGIWGAAVTISPLDKSAGAQVFIKIR